MSELIYSRIAAVSRELSKIGIAKSNENKQQGFRFRGIDDILYYLSPLLVEAGLLIVPRHLSRSVTERPTKSGGVMFFVTIEAEFDFIAVEDGSKYTARMFGEGQDSADKATAKAASAAYKNVCIQVFCIPVEGIPDADTESHEAAPAKAKAPTVEFVDDPGTVALTEPWRQVVCHVGKETNGKTLGAIEADSLPRLEWMMENFKPKKYEKGFKLQDLALREALNKAAEELNR